MKKMDLDGIVPFDVKTQNKWFKIAGMKRPKDPDDLLISLCLIAAFADE